MEPVLITSLYRTLLTGLLCLFVTSVIAATKEDAQKLGTTLTPMGANPSANKEGTIPAWSGSIIGLPSGLSYKSGDSYPDPYAKEKPSLIITANNVEQHKGKLTHGMIKLFEKHPDTFQMHIYPSHRDFRYSEELEARTRWNVGNSMLEGNIDGLKQYTGGAPFPIPENGIEAMWNARVCQPFPQYDALFDEFAVYKSGSKLQFRLNFIFESPYSGGRLEVGGTNDSDDELVAYVYFSYELPTRKRGEAYVVHEPLDQFTNSRKSWMFMPGTKRVKRAPTVGYDTPLGPGGLMTYDETFGFNGAMDRYEWKLIGKTEKFIPYHNYTFDDPKVTYDELLKPEHVNPEYLRFELKRVWVVEATLKEGQNHQYSKRRFYIDEDTWLISATDIYDGKGMLWRSNMLTKVYDYLVQGYLFRAHIEYDFNASAYTATRLINESRPTNYLMKPKNPKFYTPNNLRKMGR